MNKSQTDMIDAAITYADKGWHVYRCVSIRKNHFSPIGPKRWPQPSRQ
jgi:hypothetical protein